MLDLVRKHADSWLIKTILWSIVLTFVGTIFYSWGMGGEKRLKGNVVATVDGRQINFNEYQQTFNNLVEFYRDKFKSQFSEEMIRRLDLKTAALDAIIQKKLLLLEAEKMRLGVSDDELAERIREIPSFQKNSQFDPDIYKQFLRMRKISAAQFEETQREGILITKVQSFIKQNVKPSHQEVLEAYKREEEKVKIDYIDFDHDRFKDESAPTEDEIKSHYEKNKKDFEIPEQIQLEYVKLTPNQYVNEMTADDEEIKEQYDLKKADFRVPKQFQASHILHRLELPPFDEKATPEAREKQMKEAEAAAKRKAEETLKRLHAGEKFEDLAKALSDDKMSGSQGGSLGVFSKGTMVPEFEKVLEKMKPGEISEPALTPFGYHIVRLEGTNEERVRALAEVKNDLVRALKESKAKRKIRRMVKAIHEASVQNKDLQSAAKSQGAEAHLSTYISRDFHNMPEIGTAPEFYNAAFALGDNQVSEPVLTEEGVYVMKVVARQMPHIPELPDIREKVASAVKSDKNIAFTAKRVQEFEKSLAEAGGLEKIAASLGLSVAHSPFFNMEETIPGVGNLQDLKDKAFTLEKDRGGSVAFRKKIFLFRVAERLPAGEMSKEREKEIYSRLQKEKSEAFFQDWLANLREKTEILIDRTQL